MAGALYDVHTVEHSWSTGTVTTGQTVQDGAVAPTGERVLSASGWIQFGGGPTKTIAIEKYEFGDMVGDPDSEGCWGRYYVESDVDGLSGTARLIMVCAKETNPE